MRTLVTGASRGLGRAIALRLAADGHEVFVHYNSSEEDAKRVLEEIVRGGGRGALVRFDVTSEEAVSSALAPLTAERGPVEAVVNNAGVTANGYMAMLSAEGWRRVLSVNLDGFFFVTRACLKGMLAERRGRIVNVVSLAGERGNVGQVAYATSKAGLIGATKALALELARWNVLVNAVSPGLIDTPLFAAMPTAQKEAMFQGFAAAAPVRRVGRPEEVAQTVLYLMTNTFTTRSTLYVDGGYLLR